MVGDARVWGGPRDRGGARVRSGPRAAGVTPAGPRRSPRAAEAAPACGRRDTRVAEASPTASIRALAMLTRCTPGTIAAGDAMMPDPEQYVTERSG